MVAAPPGAGPAEPAPAPLPPIVDADWLRANLDRVTRCDVRWYLDGTPGRSANDRGHLPGAVFVEMDEVLAAPPSPTGGRHPLPDPERFARALGDLGVGDDDPVVAYDDAGGMVAGHIPGAVNVPFNSNLDAGRFLPPDQLGQRYASVGADGEAIAYCGSGVSACHDALAIEHAGLGRPRLFVGSWSAWSADPGRPVATGDEP